MDTALVLTSKIALFTFVFSGCGFGCVSLCEAHTDTIMSQTTPTQIADCAENHYMVKSLLECVELTSDNL